MEENFDEDLISERVPVVEVTSRLKGILGKKDTKDTISSPRPHIDIKHLLFKDSKSNRKTHKGRTLSIIESSAKFESDKKEKLRERQQIEQSNQMKECTFRPSVNKSSAKKRTLKEFLDSQEQFVNRAQHKRQALQKTMKENDPRPSFQPKINPKSQNPSAANMPAYQRLYNISKHSLTDRGTQKEIEKMEFVPAITPRGKEVARNEPFHEHLYTDALRRQRQQTQREEQQSCSPEPKSHRDEKRSERNDRLVAQKVVKEYQRWLTELEIKDRLSLDEFALVLWRMGFLSVNLQEGEVIPVREKKLLLEAYELLRLPTVRNTCVFVLAVVGVYNVNPVNFEGTGSENRKLFELNFDREAGREIHAAFELFNRNRLFNESSRLRSVSVSEEPAFKPTINAKSEVLASAHRSRMLEQTSTMLESTEIEFPRQGTVVISHADLLHLNKLGRDVQNMRKREQRESEELKECSFRPNSSKQKLSSDAGVKKCEELYQKSKSIVKEDRDLIDRQFEESKKECTFKPKVHKAPQRLQTEEEPAPDFDKTVARLFEGRRLKQESQGKHLRVGTPEKLVTPRSISKTPTKLLAPLQNSTHKELPTTQQPFLVIDVNLGDTVEQIIVFRRDVDEAQRLAEEFSSRHRLDSCSREKLMLLLAAEIRNVMNEIAEEDSQSWSDCD